MKQTQSQPKSRVTSVAFVAYPVSDMKRSTEFYRDVIGLKPGDMSGEHWAEFEIGDDTFGIGRAEALGIKPGSAFSAAFEVGDIDAVKDDLKQKGVQMTDINESPSCRTIFVTDPDGNRFAMHQHK
jgi:predicted enzyme related to lactoylglutathione lyase